jgi:ribonuclease P protein component
VTTTTSRPAIPDDRRLHSRTDIRAVFAARASGQSTAAVVRCRVRGDEGPARWTVVAGRKLGGAVVRNRAKRRLRAALRTLALPAGVDLVVIGRPAAVTTPFAELLTLLDRAVSRSVRQARGGRR